ncbi:MAG: hypothetical protein HYR74_13125 [Candidatus Eisenbacteria bacterium]|nr:hypothetical protein [Candidatus Eisenbacteria bacterium]
MPVRPLAYLSDATLLRNFAELLARDRHTTVELLAHILEIDARKVWAPAGYSSMYRYCVGEHHMSEDVAFKRIRVARLARRFPRVLEALLAGHLNLTGLVMLSHHVTQANGEELLTAAEDRSNAELRSLLAERFPQPDLPCALQALAPAAATFRQLAAQPVAGIESRPGTFMSPDAPEPVRAAPDPPERVTPLASDRFGLQMTISQSTHDKLRHAQELLGHQVPANDLPAVLDRALDALIAQLEKQKFAATDAPRIARQRNVDSRHIPAEVKRAVWNRDQGRCTFVSESGHRCEERTCVGFDHIAPYARGGSATVGNIRLRCHAHNQLDAERTYGVAFMRHEREAAQAARTAAG